MDNSSGDSDVDIMTTDSKPSTVSSLRENNSTEWLLQNSKTEKTSSAVTGTEIHNYNIQT